MYQLDSDFVGGNPRFESLRMAFGDELVNLARDDERIVALSADLAGSVGLGEFVKQLDKRYIEVGIAEQNLVSVASGLAHMGKIPFAASYAAFSPGRNWEQIRTTICLNNQPVKVIGSHAGLNVGPDGATHQMLEDIALMQTLPNMVVLAPGDAVETRKAVRAMVNNDMPTYLRLPRSDIATFSTVESPFEIGRAYLLRADDHPIVTIISTGSMTANSLLAAIELSKRGIPSEVVHVPTIKPLDRETILGSVGRSSITVTVEEHQVIGGLGSSVASLILEPSLRPTKFKRIGVCDQFGQSGTADELWSHYGLDVDGIVRQIVELLDE
ncbi:MAG: transketolase C-terminal domain-containing protein [Candidatus Saccharibacteria bacterium]|nr:transketolase C-terminal domain-containing protein [Candidatus Saccharibacteria bacterium]